MFLDGFSLVDVVFHCFDLFGLVLRNGCKKENVGFSKKMLSKICQNPYSCLAIG